MIQIQTTTSNKPEAQKIADRLVKDRLAACAQVVGPISSTYRWQEKVEAAEEWLVLIKTRTELFDNVEVAIRKINSYENPEIIASPIERSSNDYLSWVYAETDSAE